MRKLITLLIAITLPVFIISAVAQAEITIPNKENTKSMNVEERNWAITKEQITLHSNFLNYTDKNFADNQWNKDMLEENIRNYNLETKIGVDVDGYELSTLLAQLEKIEGTYAPTTPLKKLHEWTFIKYDIPEEKSEILNKISKLTNNVDLKIVKELVKSTNNMVNYGNVSPEIHKMDSEFWIDITNAKLCELDVICLYQFNTEEQSSQKFTKNNQN